MEPVLFAGSFVSERGGYRMKIIAGCARNLELTAPPGLGVRPTLVRSRKALFDSIGARIAGSRVLDLFSGSGAIGLEAASRGAARVRLVELNPAHIRCIEANRERVLRAGCEADVKVCGRNVLEIAGYATEFPDGADFIFADPPYETSAELFRQLLAQPLWSAAFAGAELIWEIPDTPGAAGAFLNPPHLAAARFREFAGVRFLLGT